MPPDGAAIQGRPGGTNGFHLILGGLVVPPPQWFRAGAAGMSPLKGQHQVPAARVTRPVTQRLPLPEQTGGWIIFISARRSFAKPVGYCGLKPGLGRAQSQPSVPMQNGARGHTHTCWPKVGDSGEVAVLCDCGGAESKTPLFLLNLRFYLFIVVSPGTFFPRFPYTNNQRAMGTRASRSPNTSRGARSLQSPRSPPAKP